MQGFCGGWNHCGTNAAVRVDKRRETPAPRIGSTFPLCGKVGVRCKLHKGGAMTRSIARRLALALAAAFAVCSVAAPSALGASTTEGGYGPTTFADYGTCGNAWATFTNAQSFYTVSALKPNGTYNLTLKITGRFTSNAGDSPGKCFAGGNTTITGGVRGSFQLLFYFVVSGGTFDPTATCDASCGNDYSLTGKDQFVSNFFGAGATSAFSGKDTKETVNSANPTLISRHWVVTFVANTGPNTSSLGDIATS
jgi:hypothetical protein